MSRHPLPIHPLSIKGLAAFSILFCIAISAGCSPVTDKRGYVRNEGTLQSIQIGVDNKESVYQRLGSPSTTGSLASNVWYYITSIEERFAFMAPKTTHRAIRAVAFDEDDLVAEIRDYDIRDGKVVAYVDRETPTRGKELTFLEQMFGNIGRLPGPTQPQR